MTTKKAYPYQYTQTQSAKTVGFKGLKNIKNINSSYAQSESAFQGKKGSPNRPAKLTLKDWRCKIPNGSKVTQIKVHLAHQRIPKKENKYPNIPAPDIDVQYNGKSLKKTITKTSKTTKKKVKTTTTKPLKGKAPKNDKSISTTTFKVNPTIAQINSELFAVTIDYPTNANDNHGFMRIYYCYITVTYQPAKFTVSLKKVSGGYNKQTYTIKASISNKWKTGYSPTVNITIPPGFSYIPGKTKGDGKVKSVNLEGLTWTPKLSKNKNSASITMSFDVNVIYPSGQTYDDFVFRAVETFSSHMSVHNARITDKPAQSKSQTESDDGADIDIDDPSDEELVHIPLIKRTEPFIIRIPITSSVLAMELAVPTGLDIDIAWDSNFTDIVSKIRTENDKDYYRVTHSAAWGKDAYIRINEWGLHTIEFWQYDSLAPITHSNPYRRWETFPDKTYDVIPLTTDLTVPNMAIMELTPEEHARLKDGETYTIQTYFKIISSETRIRNWYTNYRIGVFNNPIEENIIRYKENDDDDTEPVFIDSTDYEMLTLAEMIQHASYWGTQPSQLGAFESVTCEFTYHEKYPLRIFIVSDYFESGVTSSIDFTEPCIIESDIYTEYESKGNFPVPINKTIAEDSSAEQYIPANTNSNTVIFSEFDLDTNYGNDENTSIRGFGIETRIEKTDHLTVFAQLRTQKGVIGNRSIILDGTDTDLDSDNYIEIGGLGDLWNLSTDDITNIEDWQVELTVSNNLIDSDAYINYGNTRFIVYSETLEENYIQTLVNGEDISYYGAFLKNIKIPSGLKTDVDYLKTKGSDLNIPHAQTIQEKTIELEIALDHCDLNTSTDMLRQLTQLFTNERDEYNNPIPNTIEFSNYPDLTWEYILVDVIEADIEISDYDLKVKLEIPSGTAYKSEATVTNSIGMVQGLTTVKPIIRVRTTEEDVIQVVETLSGQSFDMGFSGDWAGHIVEIDCENRIAWLKESEDDTDPIDISKYVDINSDWFRLLGEYAFETTNCTLYSVEYIERW